MNFKSKIKMEGRGPISLWLGDSQVWMKTALEKDKSSGRGQSGVEVDSNELNVAHVCVGLAFELVLKALAKSERRPIRTRHESLKPDIFNTDQGAQFTSEAFTGLLERQGVTVSMDGKGSYTDNLFIERLWRSLKYEEMYLKAYTDGREARSQIGEYFRFYNTLRPHQALGYRTPAEVYTSEREADMVHSQGTPKLTKGVKTAGPDLSLPSFLSN